MFCLPLNAVFNSEYVCSYKEILRYLNINIIFTNFGKKKTTGLL